MSQRIWPVALPLLAILSSIAGCQQPAREARPQSAVGKPEVVEEYWPNGLFRLHKEVLRRPNGTTVDDGAYTAWYDNGQMEYRSSFVRGKPDGVMLRYHRNGQTGVEQHFVAGVRQGPRFTWDENGLLRKEEHFVDDKPDGTWTTWDDKGKIKAQQHFERGVPKP